MEAQGPKGEDLNMNCLLNIFGRLDIEMLWLDVRFVCKSWCETTRKPQCWSILNFTRTSMDEYSFRSDGFPTRLKQSYLSSFGDDPLASFMMMVGYSYESKFIKSLATRGNIFVTQVRLPFSCKPDALICISNECPNLRTLKHSFCMDYDLKSVLPSLVSKWKRLQNLSLCNWRCNLQHVLEQVSTHCSSFSSLSINESVIGREEATSIVTNLPNLKFLGLRCSNVDREDLLVILKGCKKLEHLDARDCIGFRKKDFEILKRSSHIRTVKLEGSRSVLEERLIDLLL